MKFAKNKTMAITIAIILMFTMTSALIALPTANATTTNYRTWIYVGTSAGDRDVGVGETQLLVTWTADMPPDIGETAGLVAAPNGRAGWYGMQINVTDPDNISMTLDLPYSDPVGGSYISYTPTKVGTYLVQAIFPLTDKVNQAGDHYIYSASVSPIATFEVSANPTSQWIESPLPSDYWTRPISDASREWYPLTGNWLGSTANVWPLGSFSGTTTLGSATINANPPYAWGSAAESAHILWTKPFYIGGQADDRLGGISFATEHYQGVQFQPTVILDGKITWSPYYTHAGQKGWEVIDLYTGETLYQNYSETAPIMGSVYSYESPNQHGDFAYLWRTSGVTLPQVIITTNATKGANLSVIRLSDQLTINTTQKPTNVGTVWEMIDAHTLNTICYIANVSTAGTQVYGKDGSYLYYNAVNKGNTTNPNYYLSVWNSSDGTMVSSQLGTGYWQWRPAGGSFGGANPYLGGVAYNYVHDGALFYSQNFSIPSLIGPTNSLLNETATIRAIRQDGVMIVGTAGRNDQRGVVQGWMMGISLKPENKGTQLWKTTFTPPFMDQNDNNTVTLVGVYPEAGVLTFVSRKELKTWVYDLNTGQELWETNDTFAAANQYSYYGYTAVIVVGDKLILNGGYAGRMTAFDVKTGEQAWVYSALNIGEESPYGNYPMMISAVSGDKIYTLTSEHSFTIPMYRGPNLRCINATDGTEIWSTLSMGGVVTAAMASGYMGLAVADGRVVVSNSLDNQIYCFGKGPSGTTVTASKAISTLGEKVMLTGTVTDQTTTGRRNTNDKIDFTLQGTPAISDDSMSAWMEYMFQKQIYPTNATGVSVSLDAIDPNGNFVHLGDTSSDSSGLYVFQIDPSMLAAGAGTYKIIASFAGSNSYYPSNAETAFAVTEAAPTTSPYPGGNLPPTEMYFAISTIAIVIAIAVVGAVIVLMLRKRQ